MLQIPFFLKDIEVAGTAKQNIESISYVCHRWTKNRSRLMQVLILPMYLFLQQSGCTSMIATHRSKLPVVHYERPLLATSASVFVNIVPCCFFLLRVDHDQQNTVKKRHNCPSFTHKDRGEG